MKSLAIVLVFSLFLLFSCNDKNLSENDIVKEEKTDNRYLNWQKTTQQQLNIGPIEQSASTQEIRLWVTAALWTPDYLYILKNDNNGWYAFHYTYWRDVKYNSSKKVDSFFIKKINPKTNWIRFINSLEQQNIYSLPSQNDIEGWENRVNDGTTYVIEYYKEGDFGYYIYNCPEAYKDRFPESQKMANIVNLFQEHI